MRVTTDQLNSAIAAYPDQSAELEDDLSCQLMDMLISVNNETRVYFAAIKGDASLEIIRFLLDFSRFYESPIVLDREGLRMVSDFVQELADCDCE